MVTIVQETCILTLSKIMRLIKTCLKVCSYYNERRTWSEKQFFTKNKKTRIQPSLSVDSQKIMDGQTDNVDCRADVQLL